MHANQSFSMIVDLLEPVVAHSKGVPLEGSETIQRCLDAAEIARDALRRSIKSEISDGLIQRDSKGVEDSEKVSVQATVSSGFDTTTKEPVPDLHFFKQVLSVAIAGLYEHYKGDVLKTFSIDELQKVVNLSESLRPRQVEDIYRQMWDMLDTPPSAQPAVQEPATPDDRPLPENAARLIIEAWIKERYGDGYSYSLQAETESTSWAWWINSHPEELDAEDTFDGGTCWIDFEGKISDYTSIPNAFNVRLQATPPAPVQHNTNAWADMAANGLQWVRNIVDGVRGYGFEAIEDTWRLKSQSAPVRDAFLKRFRSIGQLEEYAESVEDKELLSRINIVDKYGSSIPGLVQKLTMADTPAQTANKCLTTAHKSKGLEWASVKLHEDFPEMLVGGLPRTSANCSGTGEDPLSVEEANLIYVAATRAKAKLIRNSALNDFMQQEQALALSP